MKQDKEFEALLERMPAEDRAALESSSRVVIGIWPDGTIGYVNPRFDSVAREAGADPAFASSWGVGANYFAACPEIVGARIRSRIAAVLESNAPQEFDYLCPTPHSSATHMVRFYPFAESKALVLVHTLVREVPYPSSRLHPPVIERYRSAAGIVTQCMHCRCVRVVGDTPVWEFVPEFVERMPENTSHGICDPCLLHYS